VSRRELEQRVDELAAEHTGRAFADAVQELAAGLEPGELEQLQDILVARAVSLDQAVMERVDARGWLQRQWDRATTSSPPGGTRDR
jgi:hypothetical protein